MGEITQLVHLGMITPEQKPRPHDARILHNWAGGAGGRPVGELDSGRGPCARCSQIAHLSFSMTIVSR